MGVPKQRTPPPKLLTESWCSGLGEAASPAAGSARAVFFLSHSSGAFSVPLPVLALALGFPISNSRLLPLSSALPLCLLEGHPVRHQTWSSGPQSSAQLSTLCCSLPCFPTLARAVLPFALELPAPQGGCWPCLFPQPQAAPAPPWEAGQWAGPLGGHRARTRVLAPGRTLTPATETHWPGPTLSSEMPGDLGKGPPLGSFGL